MQLHEPLRILAFETSGSRASLAALTGDKLLADWSLEPPRRSAQALAPAMSDLLRYVGWRPSVRFK